MSVPKNVLILKSSPRLRSNSSALADRLADGARQTGAHVDAFNLHRMDIRPCDACEACRNSAAGECIVGDDMQTLYPLLRRADAIVIASPVYWFNLSAQAKLCIDRWYALEGPEGSAMRGKHFALLITYGDDDPISSGGVNAMRTFRDICCYLHADVDGIIYGTASDEGDIEQHPDLLEKAYKLGQKMAGS